MKTSFEMIWIDPMRLAGLNRNTTSILLLDVEAREMLIHAESDPAAADAAVDRIRTLWLELRPTVETLGKHDIAVRCDEHLAKLSGNRDAQARRYEAAALLETIDHIENLFS